jgi:hypothetical protein
VDKVYLKVPIPNPLYLVKESLSQRPAWIMNLFWIPTCQVTILCLKSRMAFAFCCALPAHDIRFATLKDIFKQDFFFIFSLSDKGEITVTPGRPPILL